MKRLYQSIINQHIRKNRQMLFLMGPRQVGKTTTSLSLKENWQNVYYFNWDNQNQREDILAGPKQIAQIAGLARQLEEKPILIFDEIHKYKNWKDFLKGLYDSYPDKTHILVTGSARLGYFKKGGDSLMGRYFYYRFHPISVAELLHTEPFEKEIRDVPSRLDEEKFNSLWKFGGYPDPFLKDSVQFYTQWKRLRSKQLFDEDLRDLSRVFEVSQMEVLSKLIAQETGQLISYTSLSKRIRVSDNTIRSWLKILSSLYYCFELRPWFKNVNKSLLKEPKYYLWDWSLCQDDGKRAENFIASHLLKAVHFWTDYGYGEYGLYFLRDKSQKEVDFIVTKDDVPWFIVETKLSHNKGVSPSLEYFQKMLKVPYAFQVVIDLPYVNVNCFVEGAPQIVSARTFLSQLV